MPAPPQRPARRWLRRLGWGVAAVAALLEDAHREAEDQRRQVAEVARARHLALLARFLQLAG